VFAYGVPITQAATINADLLDFVRSWALRLRESLTVARRTRLRRVFADKTGLSSV